MSESPYTLITGASRGIGKAFAEEFAQRKHPLALVSLPGEDLSGLAAELQQTHDIPVRYFELDLSKPKAADRVYEWCQENEIPVGTLINNAGFGQLGSFLDYERGFYENMLNLNMEASCQLVHFFLPEMKARNEGYILNVASAAAFFPLPYKSVYAGTKAFLYYFSRALQFELRKTNVHVSVVCPNGVPTNQATRARVDSLGLLGKWVAVEPEDVARTSVAGLLRKKNVIIPGALNKLTYYLSRITPTSATMRFAGRNFSRKSS